MNLEQTTTPGAVRIQVSQRAALADGSAVRLARGITSDRVSALVDLGELRWVFDISCSSQSVPAPRCRIRELRFWVLELADPSAVAGLTIDEVVARILPVSRKFFPTGEVVQLFLISRPHLGRMRRELGLRIEAGRMERNPLAEFLRKRWTGGGNS